MPRRVYSHYRDCEEFHPDGGMWRQESGADRREDYIAAAAQLMADPDRFRQAMLQAVREWPRSCETNLTSVSTNQRAWMGHAGSYLATGSPEECTRLGWHRLGTVQQRLANKAADEAIAAWRRGYRNPAMQDDLFDLSDPQPPWTIDA